MDPRIPPVLLGFPAGLASIGCSVTQHGIRASATPIERLGLPNLHRVSPMLYGWSGWDLKTQGYCLWQCMDWNREDPFNKPGAIWSYVVMWYPGEKLGLDGPVPSMRLKGFRRGLQDLEHLAILTKLNGGDSRAADAILNKYYKLANAARYSVKVGPEDTYRMRYEAFDAIESARKARPAPGS